MLNSRRGTEHRREELSMAWARLEFVLAGVFTVLAVLTVFVPTWIEEVFKIEPDMGSGALEWMVVAAFGVLAVVAALRGRHHYRAATASQSNLRHTV
jgi:hypothetical protein